MDISTSLDQRLAQLLTKADLEIFCDALVERFRTELARQLQEAVSASISAMKAKRTDLLARESHLETAVLTPRPRDRKALCPPRA